MPGHKDVWVMRTLNGWKVEYEARALSPLHYETQEAAIRFGKTLARHRNCDLFVEGEFHPIRPDNALTYLQPEQ
jgi:hypothetical protein